MSRKDELAAEMIREAGAIRAAGLAAEAAYARLAAELNGVLKQASGQVEAGHATAVQAAQVGLAETRRKAVGTVQAALSAGGLATAPWTAPGWQSHTAPQKGEVARLLRLGELRPGASAAGLPAMPALLPLIGRGHALVSFDDGQSRVGAGALEALAWRIAALSAPGAYRFVLCDPLDRGKNFASLLQLPEPLRGPRIWCDERDIEAALAALVAEIDDINQRRLQHTYADIEAYNAANPDVALPYRFVLLAGFPKGITADAARLLFTLARSGPGTGCYLLGGVLRGQPPPHGFDFPAFMKLATYVSIKGADRAEWNDPTAAQIPLQPDGPPPAALIDRLARSVVIDPGASDVAFRRIAVRKANWWQASSVDGLEAPIGLDENGALRTLALGQGVTHHILVGGTIGSGKTNLLHLLALQLTIAYSPAELELYLVDFKEGVEFQDYVTYPLPHARAVVLEAEREFGLSILQHLEREMERRSELFKAEGVNDIRDYRARTRRPLPRILMIMDEYVVLFQEDDRLSMQANETLSSLVMRSRAFGIHLLLASQRPASSFFSMNQIKSQIGLRIAFKCRVDDSTMILGEGNERAARLVRVGDACITADPDHVDATAQVRIARVAPDERSLYLRGLGEFARKRGFVRQMPTIVFSRRAPAVWGRAPAVVARLTAPRLAPLPAPVAWLGEPLRIADDVAVAFETKQGDNLAVMGSDEPLAMRTLLSVLQGLALTAPPAAAQFAWFGPLDPHGAACRVLDAFRTRLPHAFAAYSWQTGVAALEALNAELDARLAARPAPPRDRVFCLIPGLHRWLEVRPTSPYEPSPAGRQLARLFQFGPEVSLHAVLWLDRFATLGSVVGMGDAVTVLAHFAHRLALQMSADDSVNFIGTPIAERLGSERAYYRCERDPAGVMEKLKPYALLGAGEAATVGNTIRGGWTSPSAPKA